MLRAPFRPGLALSLSLRSLIRDPGSSFLAMGILALGLAAPATFFSFLVGASRPLPVPEGHRIVRVDVVQPTAGGRPVTVLPSDLEGLQGVGALEAVGGFQLVAGTLVDRDRAAARFSGAALTPQVMPLLRVAPRLGRIPAPAEAGTTVMLGHDLWLDLYGGDPSALGRTVEVEGTLRTIVAILPEGFGFPFNQNAWIITGPGFDGTVELVGRLAPGASVDGAAAELGARWRSGDATRAQERTGGMVQVKPYTRGRGEGGETVAFVGLVMVGLCLLLIACANVANLLLVRATERVRALGVQAALGASRSQLVAQLFVEALLLSVGGGFAGLVLAAAAIDATQKALAAEHFGYFWMRLGVDRPLLLAVGGLVLTTALVAGILPIFRVGRLDVHQVLKEGGAGGAAMGGGGAWSRGFVTVQLALSCGALVVAGLTGRSLADSRGFGSGVPAREVLMATVDARTPGADVVPRGRLQAMETGLSALPGVTSAALALAAPGYRERFSRLELEGGGDAADAPRFVQWNAVGVSFFATMDLDVRMGRGFTVADGEGSEPVAVISESLARRYGSERSVLGARLRLATADSATWFGVVGVVEDARLLERGDGRSERVYLSLSQRREPDIMLLVRTREGAVPPAQEVRRVVAEVSPDIPVWDVRTLADGHAYMIRVPRALASMAAAGGLAGLLVAAVGLFGLLSFWVRQRRREMGVRLALGADGRRLAREVAALALWQLAPAVVVGVTLAWLFAPVLNAFLLGTDPRSPGIFAGVATVFLAAGMLAAVVPALRAARTDPARVLRGD